MRWLLPDKVFVLETFLDEIECRAMRELDGYEPAGLTVGRDRYVQAPEVRNNDRLICDDPALARRLWPRIEPHVPGELDGWRARSLNERFRLYRYAAGQRFAPHYDGRYTRDPSEHSKLTFMVYLNEDFRGGETVFYSDSRSEILRVRPETGMALVFRHAILHEGSSVLEGFKYVLRSDVMYSNA